MIDHEVTEAVLAEWLGVSSRTVRDLAQRDLVVKTGRGRYDLKASVLRYSETIRATAAGRSSPSDQIDLVTERALLARQQRIAVEMKNDVTRGEVAPIDLMIGSVIAQNAKVRNKLLGLPTRVAQRAAIAKTAEQVRSLIESEVVLILTELSSGECHISIEDGRAAFRAAFGLEPNG